MHLHQLKVIHGFLVISRGRLEIHHYHYILFFKFACPDFSFCFEVMYEIWMPQSINSFQLGVLQMRFVVVVKRSDSSTSSSLGNVSGFF